MPRTRPAYPEEYRRKIVELVRAGRSVYELAKEFERQPSRSAVGSNKPISMKVGDLMG